MSMSIVNHNIIIFILRKMSSTLRKTMSFIETDKSDDININYGSTKLLDDCVWQHEERML